ncbi:MAG: TetR/AcrR family transcriptional regulator [Ruminococcus sp.]|nr:TetR/AcrR family transcriptional regulator [Ruminococcus sp.]
MDKKEQIILAALELAAENGPAAVSMSQIADKVGIKKPSLYNHFPSKEAIIAAMYGYLRDASKKQHSIQDTDFGSFVEDKSAEQALTMSVLSYRNMCTDKNMLSFYKLIYSQRASDPAAAAIMKEETDRMVLSTKNLFYALKVHGKLSIGDIDTAALSFAMTVHSLIDYQLDCKCSGHPVPDDMLINYIHRFCIICGGESYE